MKMRAITLEDRPSFEEPGAYPVTCTVDMTIEEAVFLAKLLGRLNGFDQAGIVHSCGEVGVYDCLTGDLFNRFWEDGVDGAQRDLLMFPSAEDRAQAAERGMIQWRAK